MARNVIHPRFLAQTAGRLGRGGNTWTRERMSGDGIGAARTSSSTTISGYAWKAEDLRTVGVPIPLTVSDDAWYFGAAPGTDLIGEDALTSATDTGLVLVVHGPADDVLPGMTLWRLRQRGG